MTPRQTPRCTIITFLTAPSGHHSHEATRSPDAISWEAFNPHRPRLSSTHVYRTCRSNRLRPRSVNRGTSDKLLNVLAGSKSASESHTFSRNPSRPEFSARDGLQPARFNHLKTNGSLSWRTQRNSHLTILRGGLPCIMRKTKLRRAVVSTIIRSYSARSDADQFHMAIRSQPRQNLRER